MKYFYIVVSILVVALLFALVFLEFKKNNLSQQDQAGAVEALQRQAMIMSRQKGSEAAVKANLASLRTVAEVLYDAENSYALVCQNGIINTQNQDMSRIVNGILSVMRIVDQKRAGLSCYSSPDKYVVSFTSSSSEVFGENFNFCIDSSNYVAVGVADSRTLSCVR